MKDSSSSSKHGGKRKNAGRPKGEGTKMVRVPLGCIERVRFVISVYKLGDNSLVPKEQIQKVLAEDKVRKRRAEKEKSSEDINPEMDSIVNKVKNRHKESNKKNIVEPVSIHPDIDEITESFKRLPRQQRRVLIKQHGSVSKAIKNYVKNSL